LHSSFYFDIMNPLIFPASYTNKRNERIQEDVRMPKYGRFG